MLAVALSLLLSAASAASLAGVTQPDAVTVGGTPLVLNGMGLREKYFIDIYVGTLYLPQKSSDAAKAVSLDAPKRVVMSFIYKEVTAEQMRETFAEGLAKLPNKAELKDRFAQLDGMMQTVKSGDEVVLDYVPGTGVTISFNGTKKGTIAGADFMRAVWSIYLGPDPASDKLKKGMLGG